MRKDYEKERESDRRKIRKQRQQEKEQGLYGMGYQKEDKQQLNQEEELDWLMSNS
jgi:hypothetical protein